MRHQLHRTRTWADLDHVCKWNPDNYGLNQSHPGAQAWYDAQLDLFASWGLDFLKGRRHYGDLPFHSRTKSPPIIAPSKAEEPNTAVRLTLSLSPGDWVAIELRRLPARERPSGVFPTIQWDRWEDIYQGSPAWPAGRRSRPLATGARTRYGAVRAL